MTSGEDEAAQAVTAGQEADEDRPRAAAIYISDREEAVTVGQLVDEDLQHFAVAMETAQKQELDKIDTALDAVEAAGSREAAVTALARATVGLNALYSNTPSAPPEAISPALSFERRPVLAFPNFHLFSPSAKELERKIDERVERYLKVANDMVDKYGPDQYQLSVGFPMLISITLTWNTKK